MTDDILDFTIRDDPKSVALLIRDGEGAVIGGLERSPRANVRLFLRKRFRTGPWTDGDAFPKCRALRDREIPCGRAREDALPN
jgi:hypothetical protein